MPLWRYGNYTFVQNPSIAEEEMNFVGDIVKAASGRLIVQPTAYERTLSLSAIFYQPHDIFKERYYLGSSYVSVTNSADEFFFLRSSFVIDVYNTNFVYKRSLSPMVSGTPVAITFDGVSLWLCSEQSSTQHTLYEVSPVDGSIGHTFVYENVPSRAVGLGYVGNFPFGYLAKLREDGRLELIETSQGLIISYREGVANYAFTSLGGGNARNGVIYILLDDKKIVHFHADDDKVLDISDVDGYMASFVSLACLGNDFYLVPNGKAEVYKYFINTVVADVYALEKEILRGKVELVDENNVSIEAIVNNYSLSRNERFYKAYNINLSVSVLS